MIAKNAENAMVCDPLACAAKLCELLETLRFVSSAGIDSMAAAIAMLRPKLASASKLVPPAPRNDENLAHLMIILPDGWAGEPFSFGDFCYDDAGEAAVCALQAIVSQMPNADGSWSNFPWKNPMEQLSTPFAGALLELCIQAKKLRAAVRKESEAMQNPAVAAAPAEPPNNDPLKNDPLGKAMLLIKNNPSLTNSEIAKQVGVNVKTLHKMRWRPFLELRDSMRGEEPPPTGSKSKDGDIEAWENDRE